MIKYCLFTLTIILICSNTFAQRQLAITIDDPNSYETPLLKWSEKNDKILEALGNHRISAALFVCGMRINDSSGIKLIEKWNKKGHLICNHSFSHLNFNSVLNTSDFFIQDFKKGDSIISQYKNYTKLFGFPYLKEGNTSGKRDSMRSVMKEMSYKNGLVTIDASDWYIDSKMNEELKKNLKADIGVFKEYYSSHILDRANYYDSLAIKLFNRKIKHTLLIHHSLLNALFLDDLLSALKKDGWDLIDAQESYKDSIYTLQPLIEPCGESIVWQCAKSDPEISKTLRYPAEDSRYEEVPLQRKLEAYKLRNRK